MSNTALIIAERAADIGNFLVGRLLPFRQKRSVGPFTFIDHMGPIQLTQNQNMDVPPHPHIGLSTLTYLFEGAIEHRDSLGNQIIIEPEAVNWMTAGKGVVHSERTPKALRNSNKTLHGLQIWVALPKPLEQMSPQFTHIEAKDIPHWETDQVQFKLIAGKAFGRESPVPVFSPLYFIELKSQRRKKVTIGKDLFGESALYILEGGITADDQHYGERQILVAKEATLCTFEIEPGSTIYIFGGDPLPEEHFIYWNFVSSDKAVIEQAKLNWKTQNTAAFPKVIGDEKEYVPLPTSPKLNKH